MLLQILRHEIVRDFVEQFLAKRQLHRRKAAERKVVG